MSNKIKQRRETRTVCPKCKHPGYKHLPPYENCNKPNFQCERCGHSWQYGIDGGKYKELANE